MSRNTSPLKAPLPSLDELKELLESRGYLTINQLAAYLTRTSAVLSLSFPPLKRLCLQSGSPLPCVEVGGQYRIAKHHIDAYVEAKLQEIEGAVTPSQFQLPITDPDPESLAEIEETEPELQIETVEAKHDYKFEE